MSDIALFESFLKWKLSIENTSTSLAYAAKAVTRNVLFPYPLLRAWHEFLSEATKQNNNPCPTSEEQSPSTSGTGKESVRPQHTNADLLEFSIPGNFFAISEDRITRAEVHEHLQRLAGAVCSEYKKKKSGRQSLELDKKSKRFHIYEGHTVDLVELREQNELIKDELLEWSDLESELKKLHQEIPWQSKKKMEQLRIYKQSMKTSQVM